MNEKLAPIIARAVLDAHFRDALSKDPQGTARIAGHKLSDEDVKTINDLKLGEWGALNLKDLNSRIGAEDYPSQTWTVR